MHSSVLKVNIINITELPEIETRRRIFIRQDLKIEQKDDVKYLRVHIHSINISVGSHRNSI